MNKRSYIKPNLDIVKLGKADIICTSGMAQFSINDAEVESIYDDGTLPGWGKQW